MNRITLAVTAVATAATTVAASDLVWTGAGDGAAFTDVANWDGTPTGGIIDPAALVDDFLIDDPAACVGCPGGVTQLTWSDPEVGSLSMSAGSFVGATGLRYTTFDLSGGEFTRMFLLNVTTTISGDATLTLTGAGNPVNLSTIAFESTDAAVHFTNETPENVVSEHLGKFTFFGLPPIDGVTFTLESDGASGAIIRALEGSYEPQTLVWTGAGDGESFEDLLNWDGTPSGGTIDADTLLDRYVINDGSVGGVSGVSQLYFFAEGALIMTGGDMAQDLGDGLQGITGGLVEVSGGVLNRQFLSMCDAYISHDAQVILNGGADPVPFGAVVDLSGDACSVTFLNESEEEFRVEHLSKFRVDGEVAIEDINLQIEPFGKTGCIVTAIGVPCPADLTGDGLVDGADLTILLGQWGGPGSADLNGNGFVDGADLTVMLGEWGPCPVNPCIGVDCDDREPCTLDYCDPRTGECHNDPIPDCGSGACGDPLSGSCSEANGSPACEDRKCCEAVCKLDSYCCDVEWDESCVAQTVGIPDC